MFIWRNMENWSKLSLLPFISGALYTLKSEIQPRHNKNNNVVCAAAKVRSALDSAQSGQILRCPHRDSFGS